MLRMRVCPQYKASGAPAAKPVAKPRNRTGPAPGASGAAGASGAGADSGAAGVIVTVVVVVGPLLTDAYFAIFEVLG